MNVHYVGNLWLVVLIELLLVVGSVNLGIFLSTFAKNEFQIVQFIPLVIVPQGLLSGLNLPVKAMPEYLRLVADCLPLTYANNALRDIMIRSLVLEKSFLIFMF